MDERARVQKALDSVYGVDLNPFAVAIARFRLTRLARPGMAGISGGALAALLLAAGGAIAAAIIATTQDNNFNFGGNPIVISPSR